MYGLHMCCKAHCGSRSSDESDITQIEALFWAYLQDSAVIDPSKHEIL